MPGPNYVLSKGYIAQSAISRFHAVKGGTLDETVTAVTGATDSIVGIAQQDVVAADVNKQAIEVRSQGITKMVASAAIAKDAGVNITATGRAVTQGAAGTRVIGVARTAAAANGDWIDVELIPTGYGQVP
jgi:hypothetical protein